MAACDLLARTTDAPLWKLLGGNQGRPVPVYDTNCGWLGYTFDQLLENVTRSTDAGFRGVKVKTGADFDEDLRRLSAVRARLGDDVMIATDANNRWDLQTALRRAPALTDFEWRGWRNRCIPSTCTATPKWRQVSQLPCCTVKTSTNR